MADLKNVGERFKNWSLSFFSLKNLTTSLLAALLVIGVGYLSGIAGTVIQQKALANQIIFTVYLLVVIIAFVLAIVAPALLKAMYTKDWPSFVYVIILEIIWLSIFILVLYLTLPTPKTSPSELMPQ